MLTATELQAIRHALDVAIASTPWDDIHVPRWRKLRERLATMPADAADYLQDEFASCAMTRKQGG